MWHYRETGTGRPLVLLRGLGMSHAAWAAVTPSLSSRRRVIAFDTAGFGSTPPLPNGVLPTVSNLVDGLCESIREMGLSVPVDMAGNSLGGWMALEAATRGIARTVVAISPAGLWRECPPVHVQYVLKGMRFAARHLTGTLKAAVETPWGRECAFAVPLSVGSRRMPACDARRAVDDLAMCPAFDETFEHTRSPFPGGDIIVPVTVAFGDRDWILPRWSRCRAALPPHTRWTEPRGWGHVPMWADPAGVSRLILDGTSGSCESRNRPQRSPNR